MLKGYNKTVIEERARKERINAEVRVRIVRIKWTVTERLAIEQESLSKSTEKEI